MTSAIVAALAHSLRSNRYTITAKVYRALLDKEWREKHGPRRRKKGKRK